MTTEPLPIGLYAKALAHLFRYRDQPVENVLGSLNLTVEAMEKADAHWTAQLKDAHRRRRGALAMTFAESFAQAREELGLLESSPAAVSPGPKVEAATFMKPPTDPLPFQPGKAVAPPAVTAQPAAQSGETEEVDLAAVLHGVPLPFGER